MASEWSKWYVYKLIDPRNSKVFYVGKGTGNRAYQHKKDAIRSKCLNEPKENTILSILNSGHDILVEFDSYFICEQSALKREAQLIHSTVGLTNIIKNKIRPVTVSLYGTLSDILNANISYGVAASRLLYFWSIAIHEDHKKLILSFYRLAKKTLLNQSYEDKVYG